MLSLLFWNVANARNDFSYNFILNFINKSVKLKLLKTMPI